VGDLEKEYEGRVRFEILAATSPEGRAAAERNGWKDARHGLECLAPDGRVVGNLPGHNYGREEIRAQVEALLAGSTADSK
jgi:hypothetical protein